MSVKNLDDQVDDLKKINSYNNVAITVHSCPFEFLP